MIVPEKEAPRVAVFGNGKEYGEPLENIVWFCEETGMHLSGWNEDFVWFGE